MKYFAFVSILLLFLVGCNNNKKSVSNWENSVETDYSDWETEGKGYLSDIDSLGYYGVYEGSIPPQGSQTLKTKLTLYNNNRYVIHSVEVGNGSETEEEHGTYLIYGDLLTLKPDNGDHQYYRTSDEDFSQLDENKQEIPVQHAQNFRLIRK